jgi:hypothetical protein
MWRGTSQLAADSPAHGAWRRGDGRSTGAPLKCMDGIPTNAHVPLVNMPFADDEYRGRLCHVSTNIFDHTGASGGSPMMRRI